MRFLALILFLLITAGVVVLAIENFSTNVMLSLVVWQTPPVPLGWLLLLAYFLGALMLYVISAASAWQEKRALLKLRARVQELEQQIAGQVMQAGTLPAANPVVPMPGMAGPDITDMTTLH